MKDKSDMNMKQGYGEKSLERDLYGLGNFLERCGLGDPLGQYLRDFLNGGLEYLHQTPADNIYTDKGENGIEKIMDFYNFYPEPPPLSRVPLKPKPSGLGGAGALRIIV